MIDFEVIEIDHTDEHWLERWSRLAENDMPSFFLSPEAISTWIDFRPQAQPLKLLIGYDSGSPAVACMIGQAPFLRHRFIRGSALHFNVGGTASSDFLYMEYNDVLIGPSADAHQALNELLQHLLYEWHSPWDELVIPGIGVDSRLATHLRTSLPDNMNVVADKESIAPYVDLDALRNSGIRYLDTLSANTRSQIRQSLRAYGAHAPVELQAAATTSEAIDIFRELTRLHQPRWNTRAQPGAFSEKRQVTFHEELITRCFPSGTIELLRVRCGEKTIACLYCFLYGARVYYYQSGFQYATDNRMRPGLVAHYLAVGRYLDAGYSTYEFLAGHDRYKVSLSNRSKRMKWLRLQRPRFRLRIEQLLRRGKAALGG